jgi:hypothetical protein
VSHLSIERSDRDRGVSDDERQQMESEWNSAGNFGERDEDDYRGEVLMAGIILHSN